MLKKLLAFYLAYSCLTPVFAQPWNYDFGTVASSSHSSGISTTFIPDPPSGSDRVRVGSTGGSFVLQNPGLASFGSGTELKISAPTTASLNKFSISDYTASSVFSTSFDVLFGNSSGSSGVASGTWSFFQGNGTTFSNDSGFSGAETFVGLRFQYTSTTEVTLNYRNGGSWTTTGLLTSVLEQGVAFKVEIYGNNSASTQTYDDGDENLAPYTFDLWINGTKFGDNLPKALITNGGSIDSWMFYGETSISNAANIFLDNFIYSNTLSAPLPVELLKFDAKQNSNASYLSWSTATELNNHYFQIERSADSRTFETIGKVEGAGTSYETLFYTYKDENPLAGWNYYRLKQVDFDGQFDYSPVRAVLMGQTAETNERLEFFPNPAGDEIFIQSPTRVVSGDQLEIYDQFGRLVLQVHLAETRDAPIRLSTLPAGVYVARLQTANGFAVGKFLVKR